METEKIINLLENIIARNNERNKYNDWSPSSFLSEQSDEIKKAIKYINQINNK
tara:strand:- start:373 stop:531 length:159 start_codon:yes stop_codon:yes gene_type:complete